MASLKILAELGVKIKIVTNSLISTDSALATSSGKEINLDAFDAMASGKRQEELEHAKAYVERMENLIGYLKDPRLEKGKMNNKSINFFITLNYSAFFKNQTYF